MVKEKRPRLNWIGIAPGMVLTVCVYAGSSLALTAAMLTGAVQDTAETAVLAVIAAAAGLAGAWAGGNRHSLLCALAVPAASVLLLGTAGLLWFGKLSWNGQGGLLAACMMGGGALSALLPGGGRRNARGRR